MASEFKLSTYIPASPEEIYSTWMTSEGHSLMTGGSANISSEVGGEFEAWDGYIHGKNLKLEYGKLIVQSWRTTEFSDDEPDSQIEITLEAIGDQTKLILHHTGLPPHGEQYRQGWVESYFEPMREYFTERKSPKKAG
jgi:activator of HSP90 ATPase